MADYYTHISLMVDNLTQDEEAWLRTYINNQDETPNEDNGYLGFSYDFQDKGLWIYFDDSGYIGAVADMLQEFLFIFRPDEIITFCWSDGCSKPRLDAYGGGAVAISSSEWLAENTYDLAEKLSERLRKNLEKNRKGI